MPVFVNRFTDLYLADKQRRKEANQRKRYTSILIEREQRRQKFLTEQREKVARFKRQARDGEGSEGEKELLLQPQSPAPSADLHDSTKPVYSMNLKPSSGVSETVV